MSPNYPSTYPNDAEETWLITAPTGSIINLQFNSFHVRFIVEFKSITKHSVFSIPTLLLVIREKSLPSHPSPNAVSESADSGNTVF